MPGESRDRRWELKRTLVEGFVLSSRKTTKRLIMSDESFFVMVLMWLCISVMVVGGVFYLKSNFSISEELREKIEVYEYENY